MKNLRKIIESGFYLFLFLLPWQTRLIWHDAYLNGSVWEYGRFSLYGTELLLWLVFLFYGVWLLKERHLRYLKFNQILDRLKNPTVLIYWLVVLFLLGAGLSIFWSFDKQLAYMRWLNLLEGITLFSLVLVFGFKLEKIAIVWVASSAIQGIFSIWQFFNQYVFPNKWLGLAEHLPTVGGSIILQTDTERWLRAYGSLPHPNMLGGFLVIALLFIFYLAFVAKSFNQRLFVLISLLAIVPALFFSFSRSAWIAFIFSLILLGVWLYPVTNRFSISNGVYKKNDIILKRIFLKILFLILVIFVILSILFWQPFLTRIIGEQDLEVASIHLRVDFIKQAWELIKDSPILGQGIGNYTLGVYNIVNTFWPGYYYQPVHNIYLLVLAELGIFGAAIFYLILGLLVWNLGIHELVLRESSSPELLSRIEKIIVFLCLISILIISLFDHYFWTLYFGVIVFWVILGLSLKQIKKS